ncbi:hypothetical protein [Ruegeria sp. HKCCA4008]|uniref:hypothetical protein n=1 Tax=Ruegeria sp. HKCCA4008 TaxID=2682999 RepID=UPI001487DC9A|nr:hypothetical protein [Ruegeria sp. HKCCA4008]
MEFIEASGVSGASFDDSIERLNSMYPNSPQSLETTQNKIGMSIAERDHYLSLLKARNFVSGSFTKNGVLNLKLTLSGKEYLANLIEIEKVENAEKRQVTKAASGVLAALSKYFLLPVAVIVAAGLILSKLGLTP